MTDVCIKDERNSRNCLTEPVTPATDDNLIHYLIKISEALRHILIVFFLKWTEKIIL